MRSTHTKNMKKMHINAENLDREFAFIKGNRPTNNRSVNTKMKSIEEYGLLSPITVVDGEKVIASGGHLVTLDGQEIADQDSDNYLAVLDGQHRLMAYIKLGLNKVELVVTEPLNTGNVDCGTHCRNEYLHDHMERDGLYGGPCHDPQREKRGIRICSATPTQRFSAVHHFALVYRDRLGESQRYGGMSQKRRDTRCLQKQDLVSAEHPMVPGGARTVYGCVPI